MEKNTIYPLWESSALNPDATIRELGISFEHYKPDPRLADLLKGRRIALVCPSPHLNGLGLGKLIDSYDLVIRVGTTAPIPEALHEDCGGRTDIIIHSFNQKEIEQAYRSIDYISQMRFVMCAMVSNDYLTWHDTFLQKLAGMGTPVQNVSDGYLYRVFKEVGTVCNVGFAGLLTLLNYDFKEIFVAGMGFYNMGNYGNIYNSDYYNQVTDKMKLFEANEHRQITAAEAREDLHRQQPQIDCMRDVVLLDTRVVIDQYLQDNLWQGMDKIKGKTLRIDIDGILCISNRFFEGGPNWSELDYNYSIPNFNNIALVNVVIFFFIFLTLVRLENLLQRQSVKKLAFDCKQIY